MLMIIFILCINNLCYNTYITNTAIKTVHKGDYLPITLLSSDQKISIHSLAS